MGTRCLQLVFVLILIAGLAPCSPQPKQPIDNKQKVSLWLRGRQKSGTTFVEYYIRNFMSIVCQHLPGILQTKWRGLECEYKNNGEDEYFTFFPRYKHCVSCSPHAQFTNEEIFELGKSCARNHTYGQAKECIRPYLEDQLHRSNAAEAIQQNDIFLLVMRHPMGVILSHYYHHTPHDRVTQYSVDAYAKHEGQIIFGRVATFYAFYMEYLKEQSILWLYEESNYDNIMRLIDAPKLRPLFDPVRHLVPHFVKAVDAITSKEFMHDMETHGLLKGEGGQNGKVRMDGYNISDNVFKAVLQEYFPLLPDVYKSYYKDKL
eukprot:m.36275 g.36275  ORF g.36275 m.36275 type:complete len:318 (-) comp9077_c0_seq1:41-994(-)